MSETNSLQMLLSDPSTSLRVKKGKPFFMAHMIAGYPSMADSEKVAEGLAKGGADIIELQIPFSDPMADGPTIAVACEDALKAGATVGSSLKLLKKICNLERSQKSTGTRRGEGGRGDVQAGTLTSTQGPSNEVDADFGHAGKPVAVMSYLNPVFRMGIPKFVKTIRDAGASALIVPDCPFDSEEGRALLAACKENEIYFVPVVSPGVPKERLQQLAKDSQGFVYCTSRQGITGANSKFAKELFDFVAELKSIFKLPIAVGFGVKSRDDVATLSRHADIVIAGSVFVNAVKTGGASSIEKTVRELLG